MQPIVAHIEYSIPLSWQSASQTGHAIIQCIDLKTLLHRAKNKQSQKKMLMVYKNDITWLTLHVPLVLEES